MFSLVLRSIASQGVLVGVLLTRNCVGMKTLESLLTPKWPKLAVPVLVVLAIPEFIVAFCVRV